MKIFNSDTVFSRTMAGLTDLILLGLLWLLISVTIVGLGPATLALYYAVAKSIRRERGNTFKEFFRALKDGWKNALLVEIFLILLALGIMMLDGYALLGALVNGTIEDPVRFTFGVLEVFFFLTIALYAFPLASRFEMRSWNIIIVSVSLAFRNFGRTLLMLVILLFFVALLAGLPEFIFLVPGICAYLLSFPMEKVLGSYLRKTGFDVSGDEDPWYLE